MKIIITETQLRTINEYFSFDDLKKGYDYFVNLDKKKHPGADTFERYKMIKSFQRWVDLIYKYTKKEVQLDGVNGINVGTVWQHPWGENFSQPDEKISRMDYTVRVFPNIDKSNPPESKEVYEEQYKKFKEVFEKVANGIAIDYIDPVADKRARDTKVTFDFLDLTDKQLHRKNGLNEIGPNGPAYRGPKGYDDSRDAYVDEEVKETEITERCWKGYTQKGMKTMFGKRYPNCVKKKKGINEDEKDSDAKWVKCRNCRHKFTQTIHKGKKSLPICPRCGTHN